MGEWISVEDELPKEIKQYLVILDDIEIVCLRKFDVLYYDVAKKKWMKSNPFYALPIIDISEGWKVTHYTPLPMMPLVGSFSIFDKDCSEW